MLNYGKYIIYYFLALADGFANFLFSVVGFYPKIDTATSFLIRTELARMSTDLESRESEREGMLAEADNNVQTARELIGEK